MSKQIILSGVQPTGKIEDFHIGNYFGAIKQWVEFQNDYDAHYMIADLHAITVDFDPKQLQEQRLNFIALLIAAGIDPKVSTIFLQSENHYHAELAWLLNSVTKLGDLQRMTQFKDKSQKYGLEGVYAGLFNYPILMAADILLYQTDLVPVGDDQTQHVELTRDIAASFNNRFANGEEVLKMPKAYKSKQGARIKRLDDPTKKMSKSDDSQLSKISILETADEIVKKISRAVTDSERTIIYDVENRAGLANLMDIYSLASGATIEQIEHDYDGKGYKEFKSGLSEVLITFLKPLQTRYFEISSDRDELIKIANMGNNKARTRAAETYENCKELLGFKY